MGRFRPSHLIGLVVLAILLLYTLGSLGLIPVSREIVLIPFLALGPLGIVGVMELGRLLDRESPEGSTLRTRSATVFGIVAFALWEVVVVVQNGTLRLWREFIVPELREALPGGLETVQVLYRGVNSIQATVDIGFDVFYCLALILFSVTMLNSRIFHRGLGILGISAAGGLLALNLWTFPRPPAEAGLVDLGPLTGIWWILVVLVWVRHEQGDDAGEAESTTPA